MMQSIRKRLSLILITCTIAAILLSALFVNIAVNSTFNKYMVDVQNQKYSAVIQYFEDVYKKEGRWTITSGQEMQHEAFMSNYCITLLNADKAVVWGMNPNDLKSGAHMAGVNKGVYTSKTFAIVVNKKNVGYIKIGQYSAVLLTEKDINFKKSINVGIAISSLIIIFIAILVSLIISKQFSHPIKMVSNTSVQLSKGNYEAKSNIKSNIEEINTLIGSINMLGEKLNHQDLLRKRLISDISHEIRTPLNVLQNNLEAMIDGVLPITKGKLNYLNDEVIRFGSLLNNLNSLKKFETEDINLNIETIFLGDLINDVCNEFYAIAKEKNISIHMHFEHKKFMILGDTDKLKQVFINLISNAVKFSNTNGHIGVSVSENKNKVIAEIRDNGIGIDKEDLPYIFERLYRGDKSRHLISGSGIGLTIVKKILTLHGASIDVKSERNKGTTFTVYFDKAPQKF